MSTGRDIGGFSNAIVEDSINLDRTDGDLNLVGEFLVDPAWINPVQPLGITSKYYVDNAVAFGIGSIPVPDHLTTVLNVGVNTHAQIDAHLSSTVNPHGTSYTNIVGTFDDVADGTTYKKITAVKETAYDAHLIDTANPHATTFSQVTGGQLLTTVDPVTGAITTANTANNSLGHISANSIVVDNNLTIDTTAGVIGSTADVNFDINVVPTNRKLCIQNAGFNKLCVGVAGLEVADSVVTLPNGNNPVNLSISTNTPDGGPTNVAGDINLKASNITELVISSNKTNKTLPGKVVVVNELDVTGAILTGFGPLLGAYLPLAGGTMTGALNMNSNNIQNVTTVDGSSPLAINNQTAGGVVLQIKSQGFTQFDFSDVQFDCKNNDIINVNTINGGTVVKSVNSISPDGVGNITLPILDATKLPLAGGTMSGDINMNTNNILNVNQLNGANVVKSVNSVQADGTGNVTISTLDATKLPLTGGTMSGAINMNTNNIQNIGTLDSTALLSVNNQTPGGTVLDIKSQGLSEYTFDDVQLDCKNNNLVNVGLLNGSNIVKSVNSVPADGTGNVTISTLDATKLPLTGGTMSGDINMNANSILNVQGLNGANVVKSVNSVQADGTGNVLISTLDATKLPLAGGTMLGDINMNGNNLTNVGLINGSPPGGGAVTSVAGKTGAVTLVASDITDVGILDFQQAQMNLNGAGATTLDNLINMSGSGGATARFGMDVVLSGFMAGTLANDVALNISDTQRFVIGNAVNSPAIIGKTTTSFKTDTVVIQDTTTANRVEIDSTKVNIIGSLSINSQDMTQVGYACKFRQTGTQSIPPSTVVASQWPTTIYNDGGYTLISNQTIRVATGGTFMVTAETCWGPDSTGNFREMYIVQSSLGSDRQAFTRLQPGTYDYSGQTLTCILRLSDNEDVTAYVGHNGSGAILHGNILSAVPGVCYCDISMVRMRGP